MNSRIRSRGFSAKEIAFRRDQVSNEEKNKLRFELGSTQAEAVRIQFYKKFKLSWDNI